MTKSEIRYLLFVLAILGLICARGAIGQTTTHTATLKITASTSNGVASTAPISIFRAAQACPTGIPPASLTWTTVTTAANAGQYTDQLPAAGTYCYYVTQGGLSSNMAGGTTTAVPLAPSITVTVN